MRQDRKCPKCEGQTFYVVERARMGDGQSANGTIPLALAAEWVGTGESGFLGEKRDMVAAHLDAWMCASCGFSELYVRDLRALAQLLAKRAGGVSFVDASRGSGGAFR